MKRFECKICKKQVRVRKLPDDVTVSYAADGTVQSYSSGTCRWHNTEKSRGVLYDRAKVTKTIKKVKSESTPEKKK